MLRLYNNYLLDIFIIGFDIITFLLLLIKRYITLSTDE